MPRRARPPLPGIHIPGPAPSRRMHPLLLLLLLALALPMAPASGRPNVLFLAVDDLWNDLGCLGATHVPTPAIDRLAAS